MNDLAGNSCFKVCGDVADPAESHYHTNKRGVAATYHLGKNVLGKPVVRYGDKFLTVDVYSAPGETEPGFLVLFCPKCAEHGKHNALKIERANKKIYYDPNMPPKFAGISAIGLVTELFKDAPGGPPTGTEAEMAVYLGGTLSVEHFRCAWEAASGVGSTVCGWTVKIDRNVARDA